MEGEGMRRVALVLATMALALLLASGVAWAVTKIGTDGHDVLIGTNESDNLLGKGGQDDLFSKDGNDNLLGGPGRDNVLGGDKRRAGRGNKNLVGGPDNDLVIPGRGSDRALGEEGNDLLSEPAFREASVDIYSGGSGNDVFFANNRPAAKDVVACGDGLDRVLADRKDVVAGDCERVYFGLSDEEFSEKVPQSFFQGLPPDPFD